MDILDYLKKRAPLIDAKIREYLPERMGPEYLEWAFGKAQNTYDVEAVNKALSKPIWDFLHRGGKRWRPALFLLITEALGGDPEQVLDFAIIPELAHEGSIMIDDVEDSGELRRGKPCTHRIFGVDIAINAGNFMYFLPTLVFKRNRDKFDSKVLLRAYEVFLQELMAVHVGQAMDIQWHKNTSPNITESQYLQMCALKTGTLARLAARLAVVLSGGTPEQEAKVGKLAESLGIAFQIQDDILSASSKEFARKKGFGDDVTEGKQTLLVIHALKSATPSDAARLKKILSMHTRNPKLIQEALDIIQKHGSIEYAKNTARRLVQKAWAEAEPLFKNSSAKKTLKALIDFSIERQI